MREREYKARSFARTLRRNLTQAEVILWSHLKQKALSGHHFRRQHPIGPYIADFACVNSRLVIEVDGPSHTETKNEERDKRRTAFLESEDWLVVRVWNNEVYENKSGVLRAIDDLATARAGRPPPPRFARSPSPAARGEDNNN
jgi:very-short-patch-repair endonuclease